MRPLTAPVPAPGTQTTATPTPLLAALRPARRARAPVRGPRRPVPPRSPPLPRAPPAARRPPPPRGRNASHDVRGCHPPARKVDDGAKAPSSSRLGLRPVVHNAAHNAQPRRTGATLRLGCNLARHRPRPAAAPQHPGRRCLGMMLKTRNPQARAARLRPWRRRGGAARRYRFPQAHAAKRPWRGCFQATRAIRRILRASDASLRREKASRPRNQRPPPPSPRRPHPRTALSWCHPSERPPRHWTARTRTERAPPHAASPRKALAYLRRIRLPK